MADIQAFHGLRYDLSHVGSLSDVVAPPYDVISPDLQLELYRRHPANVVRLILNRNEPGDDPNDPYRRAARFLKHWQNEGLLRLDTQPSLYVYHQKFQHDGAELTRRGFISRVRLEPYDSGKIFPHEQTHSRVKEDRLKLMQACRANLSQIFSIYPDPQNEVQSLLDAHCSGQPPLEAVDDNGVVHQLWAVSQPEVIAHTAGSMGSRPVYIADGHHRYETALAYSQQVASDSSPNPASAYVSMMCVSMDDAGMIVLPTFRLFRGVPPISSKQLITMLQDSLHCKTAGKGPEMAEQVWQAVRSAGRPDAMAFYCENDSTWVATQLAPAGAEMLQKTAPQRSPRWRALGVAVLHELILPHLLKLPHLPPPQYVHSVDEMIQGLKQGDSAGRDATGQTGNAGPFQLSCLVLPATLDDVRQISENRERMPAKSTYFYPKLLSGLVINLHQV